VKPERSYTRRKLRPQKQWDGTQGLLRVWRHNRNIEKKWIDFRENWRKPAWITHSTKSSAWCASAGEVSALAPMWADGHGIHDHPEEAKRLNTALRSARTVVERKGQNG